MSRNACEPACPSGVPYRDLICPFRAKMEAEAGRWPAHAAIWSALLAVVAAGVPPLNAVVSGRYGENNAEFFNSMTTLHALVMVFAMIMPAFHPGETVRIRGERWRVARHWRQGDTPVLLVAGADAGGGVVDDLVDGDLGALGGGGAEERDEDEHDPGEHGEPRVGHLDDADVGLDGAERIVRRLRRRGFGQRVEKRRFADVGKTNDAAAEAHEFTPSLVIARSVATRQSSWIASLRSQ